MKTTFAAVFALFAFSYAAHAAPWEGVFEGTIGKSRVIVELNAGEAKSDYKGGYSEGARYSYVPKVRDLSLILTQDGDTLTFTETEWQHRMFDVEEDKRITGTWSIAASRDAALGTWTSSDGKTTQPISLTRVKLVPQADVGEGANQLSATYDALWLENVTFNDAGTAKRFGDLEVRFTKDSAFGIAFPVLGDFPDGLVKAKANAMLLTDHMKSIVEYRTCLNGVPITWSDPETEPQFTLTVDYATPTVLSYTESGSVFCGGAHPNNYVLPKSIELVTPSKLGGSATFDLTPQGFGQILNLADKDERIAFENFALARWKAAAEKDAEQGKDCIAGWIDDAKPGEKDFHLSFKPHGLAVTRTDWPHVASVCKFADFNPTVIPWVDLKPYLKKGQRVIVTEVR
jgi:hypothetical protein